MCMCMCVYANVYLVYANIVPLFFPSVKRYFHILSYCYAVLAVPIKKEKAGFCPLFLYGFQKTLAIFFFCVCGWAGGLALAYLGFSLPVRGVVFAQKAGAFPSGVMACRCAVFSGECPQGVSFSLPVRAVFFSPSVLCFCKRHL